MNYNITQTDGVYRVSESHRVLASSNRPRTYCKALTDCIVTRADGSQYIIPRTARTRKARSTAVAPHITRDAPHRITSADLPAVQNYTTDA